jgi:hypothetical protein
MVTRAGPVEVDANGNTIIVGAAASDAAASGNPLLMGGVVDETSPASAGEGDARTQLVTPEGKQRIVIEEDGSGSTRAAITAAADGFSNPTALEVLGFGLHYNGTTWDKARGNTSTVVFASASRTTTGNEDLTNYDARGVMVHFNVTAVPGSDTVQMLIRAKFQSNSISDTLLTASTIVSVQRDTYIIYPGVAAASEGVTKVSGFPLPRHYDIAVVHSGSGSFTYSVDAQLIY